jgi:hypothetical protein
MPEITTTEPTKIEFIQYHQPALKDGYCYTNHRKWSKNT